MTQTSPSQPANVRELVKAWKVSGRKAQVLESRLHQAVEVARRYRRDLLRLAEQNRSRRVQAENLQQKVLELLERNVPEPAPQPALEPLPEGAEQVSAEYVRLLLQRLREAHDLVEEFETLLEFREKQVHELLSRTSSDDSGEGGLDWRVAALQRELTDARHRIRLLTQELSQQQSGLEDSERVRQLEQQVSQLLSKGDGAVAEQMQQKDAHIQQLQEQLSVRFDELKKAVATIQSARERIKALEAEVADAQARAQDEGSELLDELTSLQDEIARLQEENESLNTQARSGSAPDPAQQARLAELEKLAAQLQAENSQLKSSAGAGAADAQRVAKLEAALIDLRQKLQLAGSKYQEVKTAYLDKHQKLVELQTGSKNLETVIRTLESALEESRRQNGLLQRQIDEQRKRESAAPAAATPAGDSSEALASMEAKLKEARRSAVRAQAEAGLKRKEMAKLQEELDAMKAKVVALGGTL